jgi:hypothetical protein
MSDAYGKRSQAKGFAETGFGHHQFLSGISTSRRSEAMKISSPFSELRVWGVSASVLTIHHVDMF